MASVQISDHALVRWLERAIGMPMERYRAQLACLVEDAIASGAQNYKVDGLVYCFRDKCLVTVLTKEQMESRRHMKFDGERRRHGEAAL